MSSNTPPPTILALVARPLINNAGQPQVRLDIEGEVRQLCERLGDLQRAAELHVAIATPDNMLRLLTCRRFDVLHFSGHGGLGLLAFEDERGGVYPLTPEKLRRLLLPGGQVPFHLAFLSACHSASLAEALAEAGVPHVVAIDCARPVLDAAATAFARAFYPALLASRPLAEAFEIGRVAVSTDTTLRRLGLALNQEDLAALEEAKFLLLPLDGHHTAPLFSDLPPGELAYVAPQLTPHNLGARPPTFTGRERELHTLVNRALDHRLTTVTGLGGMGKTELAREAGRWLAERCFFPQGITFIELRGLTEVTAARARIAATLQLPVEQMGDDQALASALRGQDRLLILDDLDEVVNRDRRGMRALLKTLLDHAEPLHLLLTSREAPGGLPEKRYPLGRLAPDEATRLFLNWASLSRDDLVGTQADLAAVLDFLDRYPLAIVLAAPLLAGYSLSELLRQLQQAKEQALADPALPPEERDKLTSVTFSLELSYRRLRQSDPAAADFFPLLALFPGGVEETALKEILGKGWAEALARLRAVSLVEMLPGGRVRLPAPVRAYAERHLPTGAQDRYGPVALDYYRKLVEAIEAPLSTLDIAILTVELPNLHFWLDWGYSHETPVNGQSNSARLTVALRNYYMLTTWPPEAEVNFRCALRAARQASDGWAEANTLQAIGDVQRFRDEYDDALQSYQQALHLFQAVGSRLGEANTLLALAPFSENGEEVFGIALSLYEAIGDQYSSARGLYYYAQFLASQGQREKAIAALEQCRDKFLAIHLTDLAAAAQQAINELSGQ